MKHRIIIPLFILVAIVFVSQIVYAVPAAPSPTCEITAAVLGVEKTRTNTMGGLGEPPQVDYYEIRLDILDISTYSQGPDEMDTSCGNSYIESAERNRQILVLSEYNKNPISEGQKIKARIHYGGDEWLGGFFLSDIQILDDTTIPQDKKEVESSYWYYIIPAIIIFLAVIFYILFKKRKQ